MKLPRRPTMITIIRKCVTLNNSVLIQLRHFSSLNHSNFTETHQENFIETNAFQKSILTVGSGILCLLDPTRGDLVSTFGEVSAGNALNYMFQSMINDDEGKSILYDKPRINSQTVDLNQLKLYPNNTIGKVYYDFLEQNKVTPDTRLPVQFIKDPELAYVMQRYREIHDLVHAVLLQPTNMLGEVTIKWIEGIQTRLPMCMTGGVFGALRLRPKQRKRYREENLPWAIQTGLNCNKIFLNIYFEKRWEQNIQEFYNEMNIQPLISKSTKAPKENIAENEKEPNTNTEPQSKLQ